MRHFASSRLSGVQPFDDDREPLEIHAERGTLTKDEVASRLQVLSGFTKQECAEFVDMFFEAVHDCLVRNEPAKLVGLGTFKLRDKGARPGQNPNTGQTVPIEPRRVVTFHASQKLRDRVAARAAERHANAVSEDPREDLLHNQ